MLSPGLCAHVDPHAPQSMAAQVLPNPDVFKSNEFVDVHLDGVTIDWQWNRSLWNEMARETAGLRISDLNRINLGRR